MTEVVAVKFPHFAVRMVGGQVISFDMVSEAVTVPAHVDVTVSENAISVHNHYFKKPLTFKRDITADILHKAIVHTGIMVRAFHTNNPNYSMGMRNHFGNLINTQFNGTGEIPGDADRILRGLRLFCALGDERLLESYIGNQAPYRYSALASKEPHEVAGQRVLELIIGDFETTQPVDWSTFPIESPDLFLTKDIYDWVVGNKINAPAITYGVIKLDWMN